MRHLRHTGWHETAASHCHCRSPRRLGAGRGKPPGCRRPERRPPRQAFHAPAGGAGPRRGAADRARDLAFLLAFVLLPPQRPFSPPLSPPFSPLLHPFPPPFSPLFLLPPSLF